MIVKNNLPFFALSLFIMISCKEIDTREGKLFPKSNKVSVIKIEGWILDEGGSIEIVDSLSIRLGDKWYHKVEIKGLFFSPQFYVYIDNLKRSLDVVYFDERNKQNSFKIDLNEIMIGKYVQLPKKFEHDKMAGHYLKIIDIQHHGQDIIYSIECGDTLFGNCCLNIKLSKNYGVVDIEASESYFVETHI